jgi:hypothetical protein
MTETGHTTSPPDGGDEQELRIDAALDARRRLLQRFALAVGVAGALISILSYFLDASRFFAAYLVAYVFWLGITLGSLVWVMIYHLTGGQWGLVTRRLFETSSRLVPLHALLFLPILLKLEALYPWARPELVAQDALLQHKQPYLNIPFFLVRAVIYFVVWFGLAWILNRWSRQQDRSEDPTLVNRFRRLGGPGLAVYGLTITFAAIDWIMSLDPHWFSSIFGVLVAAGQALAALALVILFVAWLASYPPLSTLVMRERFGDLGSLLLAAVLLYAYLAFVQFLIIWSANLPEEVVWYLARLQGGWAWIVLFALFFGFVFPFAALLSGRLKRNSRALTYIAAIVLIAQWMHLHWLATPAVQPDGWALHWLDFVTMLAVGGFWLAAFLWQLPMMPLVARFDLRHAPARPHANAESSGLAASD